MARGYLSSYGFMFGSLIEGNPFQITKYVEIFHFMVKLPLIVGFTVKVGFLFFHEVEIRN